jgi:phenylacetate-CoA ligase
MKISNIFFKYAVYYPTVFIRGEWFFKYLRDLERTQYLRQDDISKIQLQRLNKLLGHSKKNVPFYKNLPITEITKIDDLQLIPFLEKNSLRNDVDRLFSVKKGLLTRLKTTGGSTGAPVTLRKDCIGMAKELAATWRGYRWVGVDVGDKQARFWGVPKNNREMMRAKLIDWIAHRKRLSAFSFSESDLKSYVEKLNQFRPDYFYGYVSMIREYAEFLERNNIHNHFKPKAIITTAEVLTERDRKLFSKVFGCRVFNEYGCGEVGTIAHECEAGSLHISSENVLVEVINSDGVRVDCGEVGELVITDLINYSTPLIRYRIKDFAAISQKECPCRRSLPILETLHGREYDMLVNSDGKFYHAEFFIYIFEDLKKMNIPIDSFQVIQDKSRFIVKVVCKNENFKKICNFVKKDLLEKFDRNLNIEFMNVDSIERETSGKLRVVKRLY